MAQWSPALVASTDVHRGVVLPEGRIIVIAVPLAALLFYLLVVRRKRGS
ncbi:MAG: hypothetical protein ABSG58_03595 [Acidimicrobiales bacterium]|jgi:hypothetical protein